MAATETQSWIGKSVARKEDRKLLTGRGSFVDNMMLPGTVYMAVVRSPYAHARINGVDTSSAAAAEGVIAAFSGEDLAGDIPAGLPCAWPVTEDIKMPQHWPVARDKVRYMGDAVAVVVATSRALACDAAEAVRGDVAEPSAGTSCVSVRVLLSSSIHVATVNTTQCPSGEMRGLPTVCTR